MSLSSELNKQLSISEVITEKYSVKEVFCSVKKLFTANFRDFDSNFQNDILKDKLNSRLILKRLVVQFDVFF